MNNTGDELKQLEHATSEIPERALDEDAAALREGWRVLSSALDRNDRPFDEVAFLCKFQRELADSPALPVERSGKNTGWLVVAVLVGTLAASLLLVVAIVSGRLGKQPIAQPTPAVNSQENLVVAPNIKAEKDLVSPWDDPLDSQISVAAAQMQTMQKPALPLDASISTLNYHLRRMAEDLDEGAL